MPSIPNGFQAFEHDSSSWEHLTNAVDILPGQARHANEENAKNRIQVSMGMVIFLNGFNRWLSDFSL